MSLRLRLTLTYSVLLAEIMVTFSVVLFLSMDRSLQAEMDRRLEVRASEVRLVLTPRDLPLAAQDVTVEKLDFSALASLANPPAFAQVLARDGSVVGLQSTVRATAIPADPAALAAALSGQSMFTDGALGDGSPARILTVPISTREGIIGVLQVGASRAPVRATMEELGRLLLLLGTAALLIAGVVGWVVATRGLQPLRSMAARARSIALKGSFSERVGDSERRDEVGQVAQTVDQLLETVEATLRRHREFLADTSHELRNPLLAIQTNLELLQRVRLRAARAECVNEALEQIQRMSRLVRDLLALAQAEAEQLVELRPVALDKLVASAAHQAGQQARGRHIEVEYLEPIELAGDEGRLSQVLANLVDNALEHTADGGTVRLRLERQDGWARLQVVDDGEGISAEELPHVFDRFYQAQSSRGSKPNGAGLGLSIVKHLVEAHAGHVTAESSPGRGSCFTVWLPVRRNGAASSFPTA